MALHCLQAPSENEKYFLENLSLALTEMSCEQENIMMIGDFNLTFDNKHLKVFMKTLIWSTQLKIPLAFILPVQVPLT